MPPSYQKPQEGKSFKVLTGFDMSENQIGYIDPSLTSQEEVAMAIIVFKIKDK